MATTADMTTSTTAAPGAGARPVKLSRPETTLQDKYVLEQGTIFISGIQALVRVLLDQHRADQRAGLNTATFVSGYQGSPLGGFDKELLRLKAMATEHGITFTPGLNEELADAVQLLVVAAERRALVARDHRGGVQAGAAVGAHLLERHAHERVDAGEEDEPVVERVLVVERHLAPDRGEDGRLRVGRGRGGLFGSAEEDVGRHGPEW